MLKLLLFVLAVTGQRGTAPIEDCAPRDATRVWTSVITRVAPRWTPTQMYGLLRGVILLDVWIDERGAVQCVEVVRSTARGSDRDRLAVHDSVRRGMDDSAVKSYGERFQRLFAHRQCAVEQQPLAVASATGNIGATAR